MTKRTVGWKQRPEGQALRSVVGPFEQAVREEGNERIPSPSPQQQVTDASGCQWRVEDDQVIMRAPGGIERRLAGAGPLPVADLTCLDVAANGEAWVGSRHGAVRWNAGNWERYASRRWLPGDEVRAVQIQPDGGVVVDTSAGMGTIALHTMTLDEKAAHYQRLTQERHHRFGFVTGCHLQTPGDLSTFRYRIDDNDGLWTAMYIAAQAFRYAVTGEPAARKQARQSMRALLSLEALSDIAGYPARALTHRSEPEFGRQRGGEWHRTADGQWEWKGDTSSDEIVGHYFAWPIYFDLVADEDEERQIVDTVRRVTDHILDHGLYLVDVDGRPSTWGVWAPEKLNDDPEWRPERGLNSLEILSHLTVAHYLTGDGKYRRALQELIDDHGYALNALEQKVLPGDFPGAEDNHSDDELAFLSYYPLLMCEADPLLRSIYLASLERSWQIERPERGPLWNFIYGAVSGRPCDVGLAVEALQETPLDLVEWRIENGHRRDIEFAPTIDRFARRHLTRPLSWRERPIHKWNGNPYLPDGGNDCEEECGTFWLLPYWMGRWHRLIEC